MTLGLREAVLVSVVWGVSLLAAFSYHMARGRGESPWRVVGEHLVTALAVVVASYTATRWIASIFGG